MTIEINNEVSWNKTFKNLSICSGNYKITADITFSSQPNIPILTGILDGCKYALTFNYEGHNGFVRLGANGTVKNIKVVPGSSGTIALGQGGLCNVLTTGNELISGTCTIRSCSYIGNINSSGGVPGGIIGGLFNLNYKNLNITNCSIKGDISNAGGICSFYAGYNGICTISFCSLEGNVFGESGGICANGAGYKGNCIINNCSIKGNVLEGLSRSAGTGGICGNGAGLQGRCEINNCSLIGNVSGPSSGGICGSNAGSQGNCIINNCSIISNISGPKAGGICGYWAGYNKGSCIINNCSIKGDISGASAGGICGEEAGYLGSCKINNCSIKGNISETSAGGICGALAGNAGSCMITSCFIVGNVSGEFSGGICGTAAGVNNGSCNITKCSMKGTISGKSAGGICGYSTASVMDAAKSGSCTITQSYATGEISGEGAGGICGAESGGNCKVVNCYTDFKNISDNKNIGGLVGNDSKVTINNSYVTGCWNKTNGAFGAPKSAITGEGYLYKKCKASQIGNCGKISGGTVGDICYLIGKIGKSWDPTIWVSRKGKYPILKWEKNC